MQIVGTKYNKFLDRQPKTEISTWSSLVEGLTFISIESNNKDKEKIKGYSKVNVISIVEANVACTKKLEAQKKQSNLMKVLKRKAKKEKKYTIRKSTRSSIQEPAIVTKVIEDIEVEIEDTLIKLELDLVEKKKTRTGIIPWQ